jgi:hypothetical protein
MMPDSKKLATSAIAWSLVWALALPRLFYSKAIQPSIGLKQASL